MNALEFWGRIFWGVIVGIIAVSQFSENHPLSGMAALVTTIFIVFSPIAMRHNYQRPGPLSALKHDFDIYMLLV